MSSLTMSPPEREAFVAAVRVGILAVSRPGEAPPLAAPIWYAYEDGDLLMLIGADSQKARLLRASPFASLCVQTEALPYQFVTAAGPVGIEPADHELRRRIAARYLPAELVDAYLEGSGGEAMVTIRLTPRTWHSNDFGKASFG